MHPKIKLHDRATVQLKYSRNKEAEIVWSTDNTEHIYAATLPEEVLLLHLEKLLVASKRAAAVLDALKSFYGQGLSVVGWHLNGDEEMLDSFFDDNMDGTELTELKAAIAEAEKE